MAITRHGINRADTGALMCSSFEETVEILAEAAMMGSKDDCHGIMENVLFGQMAPMGTGAFSVELDLDMLKDIMVDNSMPMLPWPQAWAMAPPLQEACTVLTQFANVGPDFPRRCCHFLTARTEWR